LSPKYHSKSNRGFTLIEMMIAITIGLMILAALSTVAFNSARSTRANDRTSELQTSGRYGLDVLRRDLQHAGQTGITPPAGLAQAKVDGFFNIASGVAATNDCATNFALKLEEPITGSNDSNGYTTCIPNTSYLRGDIIVVRYADMATAYPAASSAVPADIANGEIYFRSTYTSSGLFKKGGTAPTIVGAPMQDQLMKTYVYYVSPNTAGSDGIPALYRMALNGGAMSAELVVTGIENLQAQYGVVNATGDTQYKNANSVTAAEWPMVRSVRVWLLARNSQQDTGEAYSNTTSYVMGDTTYTPVVGTNDKFRRQLYTSTIQLRNGG
jgi:type IV pilus assembly protein PilW